MENKFMILALTACACLFQACEKQDSQAEVNKKEVQQTTEAYSQAFNRHDADELASLWDNQAFYINISTEELVEGRENLAAFFRKLMEQKKAQTMNLMLSNVSSSGKDEALAEGIVVLTFNDQHIWKGSFAAQYIRKEGHWYIKSFSVGDINTPPSHFENLKPLDWLAGSWEDVHDPIEIEFENVWDQNKNFLSLNYIYSILGQKGMRGMEILGWDPNAKKVHSWIFDSYGGYGESVWNQNGNVWTAASNFTLSQGGQGSSTQIYTQIDKDSFTLLIKNRKMDGKALPDSGPFKLIRKQKGNPS